MKRLQSTESQTPNIFDVLLAIALTLFAWVQILSSRTLFGAAPQLLNRPVQVPIGFQESFGLWAYLLLALCYLPLIWRRRFPLTVFGITLVTQIAVSLITRDSFLALLGLMVALYTVGLYHEKRTLISATLIAALAITLTISLGPILHGESIEALLSSGSNSSSPLQENFLGNRPPFNDMGVTPPSSASPEQQSGFKGILMSLFIMSRGFGFTQFVQLLALLVASAALGAMLRTSRQVSEEAEKRIHEVEKNRKEQERRRLEEERLRIARELHDITAHSLSVIAVQAGAAEKVSVNKPELAQEAMRQIRLTSKSALEELRSIVGVLRSDDSDTATLVPAVGIERIQDLIDPLQKTGITVSWYADLPEQIPAFASVALYRVIQEATTNILRHGQKVTEVSIQIKHTDQKDLTIRIEDNGRASQVLSSKENQHGIQGMRERITALGGTFEARTKNDLEGSGFIVSATLPLRVEG